MIHRKHVELEGLALERAMGVGLRDYGDRSFLMDLDQLDKEAMEEAADLVVNEAIFDMKEKGVIP